MNPKELLSSIYLNSQITKRMSDLAELYNDNSVDEVLIFDLSKNDEEHELAIGRIKEFVDICERTGDAYSGQAKKILGNAILKNGDLAAFLHYFYKISEEIFARDAFAFTSMNGDQYQFDNREYLNRIREILANELNVMNTASMRGGQGRVPFQGELAVLSKFGFIGGSRGSNRFRLGNGLIINWPLVQEYLNYEF